MLPSDQVLIANAEAIDPLVAMLKSTCTEGEQEEAASALANLAVSIKNQKKLIDAKSIPALTRLVTVGTDRGKEQAAAALRNLTASNVGIAPFFFIFGR